MTRLHPALIQFGVPLLFVFLLGAAPAGAAPDIAGLWDATVVANKVDVPFHFEIARSGGQIIGYFFEGNRKVGSTSGTFENGALTFEYNFLNTVLEATLDGDELHGTYRNKRPRATPLVFRAKRFKPTADDPVAEKNAAPKVAGNWAMYKTAQDNTKLDVSWRLNLRQSGGGEVSGAILKTSGDTGALVGRWNKDGTLVMSHFAGERPLLFEAKVKADGTLDITLDRQFTYRAARTREAAAQGIPEPPDLSRFTSMKDPNEPFHFSGRDLEGRTVTDADPRFQGHVVLASIGGSWCPNCHDEAPFLVELYKQYHARGLEIVGLFYENDADLAVAKPRVMAFITRYGVQFPILVPGTTDQAVKSLPQLVNFGVYPTSLILGRDGRVRSVHAGFASAATGDEHVELKRSVRRLVEQLLAEKRAPAADGRKGNSD